MFIFTIVLYFTPAQLSRVVFLMSSYSSCSFRWTSIPCLPLVFWGLVRDASLLYVHSLYLFFPHQVPVVVCAGCWVLLPAAPLLLYSPVAGEEARWGRRNSSLLHCHCHLFHWHSISCTSNIKKERNRSHSNSHHHHWHSLSNICKVIGQILRERKQLQYKTSLFNFHF